MNQDTSVFNLTALRQLHESRFHEKFESLKKENRHVKGKGLFKSKITLNRVEVQTLLNISNSTITRIIDEKKLIPEKGRSINSPHHFSFSDVLKYFVELQINDQIKQAL